ncbi:small polypeptide DEVIL 14 [Lactuca sativa]|nr:small polypeptide DEVIL 14 [Lactuca sativa]
MAAAGLSSFKTLKQRSLVRCSKQIREQKARLYIIWRCTMFLMCSHD